MSAVQPLHSRLNVTAVHIWLTHGGEMTFLIRLVYLTQIAIDPLKVHNTLDTEHPGTVFCGIFACATKPGVKFCCRSGEWGHGVAGARHSRGWCITGDCSYTGVTTGWSGLWSSGGEESGGVLLWGLLGSLDYRITNTLSIHTFCSNRTGFYLLCKWDHSPRGRLWGCKRCDKYVFCSRLTGGDIRLRGGGDCRWGSSCGRKLFLGRRDFAVWHYNHWVHGHCWSLGYLEGPSCVGTSGEKKTLLMQGDSMIVTYLPPVYVWKLQQKNM